jgi:hypothetical protein
MRSLQLTDNFCLHGLSKEEYEDACIYIERKLTSKDDAILKANEAIFFAKFKFDINTIVGDTDLSSGNRSLPSKVAEQIFEHVPYGDKTSYQCFASPHWKEHAAGLVIHEDIYSSVECAIIHLGKPFAFIITKVPQS